VSPAAESHPTRPRRVCVVITARPSYSRIKTALDAIRDHPDLELQLVVAASALLDRYGTVTEEIERDGFTPDAQVFMVLEGENPVSMAKTTGIGLIELSTVFANLSPDVVVTVADRYETIATAIAAAYMNIPLVHIQGGEVTGSIDEKVRHSITKLADIHLVSTEQAAARVRRMGEHPESVIVTGCPSVDLAAAIGAEPTLDFDPFERYGGVGPVESLDEYIVVMQHPVTTEYALARTHVEETLHAMRDIGIPVLWFWPNVDAGSDGTSKGIRAFREFEDSSHMHFFKNMAPTDFLRLIANASCLVGNSSVGIRESAYLGVPVVNIGSRQTGRERGANVLDTEYDRSLIRAAIDKQIGHGRYAADDLYGDGKAGPRVAQRIAEMPLTVVKRISY
jgi:UDP-hydrolysing UDP-N-acetyl-D-glucosamine 2-epimerase